MSVNGVGGASNNYQSYTAATDTKGKKNSKNDEGQEDLLKPQDTYIPSSSNKQNTISKEEAISNAWAEMNTATETLKKMVERLIGDYNNSKSQGFWAVRAEAKFSANFKIEFDFSTEEGKAVQAQAKELISDDGFFGVKQTTDRIMNFAKALGGEDASSETIETLRKSVQKGFDQVAKLFGGKENLPEVSMKTYDSIMNEFDNWLGGGAAATASAEEETE